jgi:serine/threonine protein kinase
MGTCMQGRDMCIVTEFIERGSLREVLKDTSIKLSLETILQMALNAAKGMNYLHTYNPPIIHRDLKSHNLLGKKDLYPSFPYPFFLKS